MPRVDDNLLDHLAVDLQVVALCHELPKNLALEVLPNADLEQAIAPSLLLSDLVSLAPYRLGTPASSRGRPMPDSRKSDPESSAVAPSEVKVVVYSTVV